jgi:hypothetical protein
MRILIMLLPTPYNLPIAAYEMATSDTFSDLTSLLTQDKKQHIQARMSFLGNSFVRRQELNQEHQDKIDKAIMRCQTYMMNLRDDDPKLSTLSRERLTLESERRTLDTTSWKDQLATGLDLIDTWAEYLRITKREALLQGKSFYMPQLPKEVSALAHNTLTRAS